VIDIIHQFAGVMHQLFNFWFASEFAEEPYSIRANLATVEQKLKYIRLPSRYIRPFPTDAAHLKAHEYFTIAKYIVGSVLADFFLTMYSRMLNYILKLL
jgi:hypothetical protein